MTSEHVQWEFGRVLWERRNECGLSQEALALSADVDRAFVRQMERGIRQPALRTIWKLARALDTKPSVLLSEVERALR